MMQFKDDIRIRQRQKQKRVHWSRVWFISIGVFIVFAATILGYFYISLTPMRDAEQRLQKVVKEHSDIITIKQISVDYRQKTTYAVIGTTKSGQEKVAIIHGDSTKVNTYNRKDGLSDRQLKQLIVKTYNPKKIYSAKISEYHDVLVWEVSYESQKNTLNLLTLDFKTGEVYRSITGL